MEEVKCTLDHYFYLLSALFVLIALMNTACTDGIDPPDGFKGKMTVTAKNESTETTTITVDGEKNIKVDSGQVETYTFFDKDGNVIGKTTGEPGSLIEVPEGAAHMMKTKGRCVCGNGSYKEYYFSEPGDVGFSWATIMSENEQDAYEEYLASLHKLPSPTHSETYQNVQLIASEYSNGIWDLMIAEEDDIEYFKLMYNDIEIANEDTPGAVIDNGV